MRSGNVTRSARDILLLRAPKYRRSPWESWASRLDKSVEEPMYAKIRDTELFFDVDGSALVIDGSRMRERPTVILLHGGPGVDHTAFKSRLAQLAGRMQLIYFDQRGNGRSARGAQEKWTLQEHVEDLEALRQHLGLGPVVTLGTSYGAMVAMAHAARHPESVSHLVLIAPAAHSGYVERAKQIVAQRGTAEQIAQCEDLFGGKLDTPEKMRHYFEVMGPLYSRKNDPVLSAVALQRFIWSPEALNGAHGPDGFLREFDLRPCLSRIIAPTLICAGRYDWICAPEFAEEIHHLIPHSDLRIFEESAHAVAGDEPQALLDAISGFLVYNAKTPAAEFRRDCPEMESRIRAGSSDDP